jgi:Cu/Zn superoxide dismutase
MSKDSLSFEPGRADTITGRAIVVHAKADNAKGNAGAPIACGVISARDMSMTGSAGAATTE